MTDVSGDQFSPKVKKLVRLKNVKKKKKKGNTK